MPYIRPIQLLRLQEMGSKALYSGHDPEYGSEKEARSDISLCPVCGEQGCGEAVMRVNDYLFHESDVEGAEEVGVVLP